MDVLLCAQTHMYLDAFTKCGQHILRMSVERNFQHIRQLRSNYALPLICKR